MYSYHFRNPAQKFNPTVFKKNDVLISIFKNKTVIKLNCLK